MDSLNLKYVKLGSRANAAGGAALMLRFLIIRILQALPVIFVVITATFFLVRSAPGGPFDQEKVVIPEVKKALEAQYRLDLPLHEQYFAYLGDLAQGDLGPSFKYPGRSVNEILFSGLPVTAELGLYALMIALVIGVTAGVFASLKPNTAQDYVPMSLAMIGICMPSFLLGPLLVLIFGIWLDWLPITGWGDIPGDKILPSVTLGLSLCRLHCTIKPRRHARNSLSGLHSHRARQRPARMARGHPARTARRADSGDRLSRSRLCRLAGGLFCGRDHFSDSGSGTLLCAGRF
jgi:hypothetical protein